MQCIRVLASTVQNVLPARRPQVLCLISTVSPSKPHYSVQVVAQKRVVMEVDPKLRSQLLARAKTPPTKRSNARSQSARPPFNSSSSSSSSSPFLDPFLFRSQDKPAPKRPLDNVSSPNPSPPQKRRNDTSRPHVVDKEAQLEPSGDENSESDTSLDRVREGEGESDQSDALFSHSKHTRPIQVSTTTRPELIKQTPSATTTNRALSDKVIQLEAAIEKLTERPRDDGKYFRELAKKLENSLAAVTRLEEETNKRVTELESKVEELAENYETLRVRLSVKEGEESGERREEKKIDWTATDNSYANDVNVSQPVSRSTMMLRNCWSYRLLSTCYRPYFASPSPLPWRYRRVPPTRTSLNLSVTRTSGRPSRIHRGLS